MFLLLFQSKNAFFYKSTSKVVLKLTHKLNLRHICSQIIDKYPMKQKITGNYWSPAVICSADKLQPKQPLIFPMTVLFFY